MCPTNTVGFRYLFVNILYKGGGGGDGDGDNNNNNIKYIMYVYLTDILCHWATI
jgi:hypothetical protein